MLRERNVGDKVWGSVLLGETVEQRGGLAEQGVECGEQVFDGIQIGGVGREIADVCRDCFNSLFDARYFVTAQVVRDDEIAGVKRRAQELLDILEE